MKTIVTFVAHADDGFHKKGESWQIVSNSLEWDQARDDAIEINKLALDDEAYYAHVIQIQNDEGNFAGFDISAIWDKYDLDRFYRAHHPKA